MKKVAKTLLLGILALAAIIGVYLVYIGSSDIPSYETTQLNYHVTTSPESELRGQKLAMMLCASCHLDRNSGKLTGKLMLDAPPEFGVINAPNITGHKEAGIGSWTDAELLYLLRTGIKRDGTYAPPYMAKLPNMADEDINAIISFLRSDDPMVMPDPTPSVPSAPSFLTKFLCRVAFKPFPMPDGEIPMPDATNSIELGKYLAHNLECFSCHSNDFKTNDFLNPENSQGYYAGGNKPLDEQGRVMLTANLTPDEETGIGTWSKKQFIEAVKYGVVDGEKALQYPMMPYALLSDEEAGAIFDYLQTIPAISNKVERSIYD